MKTTTSSKSAGRAGKKRGSTKTLKKEADRLFSIWIRKRDTREDGTIKCYTCPHVGTLKTMQNGHFVPRQYLATRYDEVNCHAQCYACNMLFNGQPSLYALRLEAEYGAGTIARLEEKRRQICHDFDYQSIIEKYS